MTLQEFFDKLESHDWHYAMADDSRSYNAGKREREVIDRAAAESERHQSLLDQYQDHVFSGPGYGTEKAAKPERPEA